VAPRLGPIARLAALALTLLAWAAGIAPAAPLVTPPTRSPSAPVAGDTLFFDDFSQGLDRWTLDPDTVWAVHWGALCAQLADVRQLRAFAYAGSETWTDYAVDLDVCQMRGVDKGLVVRVRGNSGLAVDVRGPGYQDVLIYRRELALGRARAISPNGVWHHLRVECRGENIRVLLDGALVIRCTDRGPRGGSGRIALPAYTGGVGECTVYYDNVLVTRLR
jgi:3-keto-disaccharide hydrolase